KDEGGGRRYESEELARARRSKPARRTPNVLLSQGAPHRVPPHHANAPALPCVLSGGSGTPGVSATFITPSRWWLKTSNASSMASRVKRCVTNGDRAIRT